MCLFEYTDISFTVLTLIWKPICLMIRALVVGQSALNPDLGMDVSSGIE